MLTPTSGHFVVRMRILPQIIPDFGQARKRTWLSVGDDGTTDPVGTKDIGFRICETRIGTQFRLDRAPGPILKMYSRLLPNSGLSFPDSASRFAVALADACRVPRKRFRPRCWRYFTTWPSGPEIFKPSLSSIAPAIAAATYVALLKSHRRTGDGS